jgi:formate hydrogenlyase subunit 3/multisubunit Na+/H+ antiporter MnhD subunit
MGADGLLLVLVFALCGAGALAGIVVPERRTPALLAWVGSLAALAALWVSADVLRWGRVFKGELWTIQPLGTLAVSLDRLSALFLFVAAVVVLASSVFSASYLKRYLGHYSLKALNAWYLLLIASIALILIADDALLFLLAWEAMSITSYLLVNFENERDENSRAGYLMLAMGEAGFVAVVVALLFLATNAGSLEFSALKTAGANLGSTGRWAVFLLTFFGFGVKAGLVPVNTWLPPPRTSRRTGQRVRDPVRGDSESGALRHHSPESRSRARRHGRRGRGRARRRHDVGAGRDSLRHHRK